MLINNDEIKKAQEWYAKERGITIGEFDDYDVHSCRVAASYHKYKVENLGLFDVILSLLGVAKCPNGNCDNNGTIATQEYPSGEWIPKPCEWCHRKKELLNNEG